METDIKPLIKTLLEKIPKELGYEVRHNIAGITLYTNIYTGLQVTISLNENNIFEFYFYHRTRSWEYDGERSDIHDVISGLLTTFLKIELDISCSLHDVPHPAIDTECEIYARFIVPRQTDPLYTNNATAIESIIALLTHIVLFEQIFWHMVGCPCDKCRKQLDLPHDYTYKTDESWLNLIQRTLKTKSKKLSISSRYLPTWNYYKNCSSHISIIQSIPLCTMFFEGYKRMQKQLKVLTGINGSLHLGIASSTFLSYNVQKKILSILTILDKLKDNDIIIFQVENMTIAFGASHVVFVENIGGLFEFNEEKEIIRKRHLEENELLFKPNSFTWQKNTSPSLFENLIKDLLEREQGVNWVRKVSHTNEPDGGRDLIANWRTGPLEREILQEGENPFKFRKVIVQCKASNVGVGKAEVKDIRDTIEHFNYDGYFLAVSSHLKRNLTDALDKMRSEGKYWINWWGRDEIENRLSRNQDLLSKYSNIIALSK